MKNGFDFNKIERKFFNVTLKDNRVLMVKMPPKSAFEKITKFENSGGDDSLGALDEVCAELLSNNLKGEHIPAQYVGDNFDLEEKLAFMSAYMEFVKGAANNPN